MYLAHLASGRTVPTLGTYAVGDIVNVQRQGAWTVTVEALVTWNRKLPHINAQSAVRWQLPDIDCFARMFSALS